MKIRRMGSKKNLSLFRHSLNYTAQQIFSTTEGDRHRADSTTPFEDSKRFPA